MKTFIYKILCFIVLALGCLILFWALLVSQREKFFKTDANILVCGNSTVEYGVDDSLLPNSLNVGFNAEHPEFIYAKVKLFKKYNPDIDTVMICIDDAMLSKNISEGYNSELHHFYFYDQIGLSGMLFMFEHASLDWIESYLARPFQPVQLVSMITALKNPETINFKKLGIGGYYDLYRNKLKEDLIKHADKTSSQCKAQAIKNSELSTFYIGEIAEYCKENDIKMIFFTTPKHSIGQSYGYKEWAMDNFPNVKLMDYTNCELPDSCFGDTYHINKSGASIFTEIMRKDLLK